MRLRAIAVPMIIAVLASASATASAGAETIAGGHVIGGGTISPGLTLVPTFQFVTFSGTFTGFIEAQGHVAAGVFNCSFTGGSTIGETVLQGQGTVSGSCSGGNVGHGTKSCVLTYVRVGSTVVTTGNCVNSVTDATGSGTQSGIESGQYHFVPDQITPPVTSYRLSGDQSVVGV
jgi:hypothetical protein